MPFVKQFHRAMENKMRILKDFIPHQRMTEKQIIEYHLKRLGELWFWFIKEETEVSITYYSTDDKKYAEIRQEKLRNYFKENGIKFEENPIHKPQCKGETF